MTETGGGARWQVEATADGHAYATLLRGDALEPAKGERMHFGWWGRDPAGRPWLKLAYFSLPELAILARQIADFFAEDGEK